MKKFSITTLGCRAAIPEVDKPTSSSVITYENKNYLIDAAEGIQLQLKKFKIKVSKINDIFISHLHGDHYFGLFGLLSTLSIQNRREPLNIFAPEDLEKILETVFISEQFTYKINFFPLPKDFSQIKEDDFFKIYSFKLKHSIDSWGFLFEEKPLKPKIIKEKIAKYKLTVDQIKQLKQGKDIIIDKKKYKNSFFTYPAPKPRKLAYLTDTSYYPQIVKYIKEVDLLYHEATYTEKYKELAQKTLHSTAKQAAEIAKLAKAKKLLIGHFSQREPTKAYLEEAQKIFKNTIVAKAGLSLTL